MPFLYSFTLFFSCELLESIAGVVDVEIETVSPANSPRSPFLRSHSPRQIDKKLILLLNAQFQTQSQSI